MEVNREGENENLPEGMARGRQGAPGALNSWGKRQLTLHPGHILKGREIKREQEVGLNGVFSFAKVCGA